MLKMKYKKGLMQILEKRRYLHAKKTNNERISKIKDNFNRIKEEYSNFHAELLKKGMLPVRSTERGFWGISVCDEIFELFQKINLSGYRNLIDLGSGDGRVVLIASLFTDTIGIEYDQELINKSLEIKRKLGLSASFLKEDFYNHDLSQYDLIFSFPDEPLYRGLDNKLKKELRGRLILYGPFLNTTKLQKEGGIAINGDIFSFYRSI